MPQWTIEIPYQDIPWEYYLEFCGQRAEHSFYAYHIISEILKHNEVHSIIELGTAYGALTLYLGLWGLRLDVPVATFDIESDLHLPVAHAFMKMGVQYHNMDILSAEAEQVILEIIDNKPTYLVVDGGDKKKEFARYARLIPTGSVISIHDYETEFKFGEGSGIKYDEFKKEEWKKHDMKMATIIKLGNTK